MKFSFCTKTHFVSSQAMKKFLLVSIVLVLAVLQNFAQRPGGWSGGQAGKPDSLRTKSLPKIGKVYGSIREEGNNRAVPFAPVAVLSVRDSSLVGGGQTNEKGNFIIYDLPSGRFILKVNFLGFKTGFSEPFGINQQALEVDAGIIKLKTQAQQLKDVEVVAEKNDFLNGIDRKVYNVDKNIVNTGGTVTEVLQNIPSVTVDIDGTVALRGSQNVTILIDGKPSGMLGSDRRAVLQQIPASAIEAIEVVTNPSAKYDASGMAGIINIKTKKEKMRGMNGNLSAGVGTNDKYSFSIGGNNRSPRMNLYTNYTFRHETRSNTAYTDQHNFLPNVQSYFYHSNTNGTNKNDVHTGRLGADFYLNKYNTWSISGSVTSRKEVHPEQIAYTFRYDDNTVFNQYHTENNSNEKNFNYDLNTDYKKTWQNSKREWTSSAGFSTNNRDEDSYLDNSLYNTASNHYQLTANTSDYKNVNIQSDLIQPIKTTGKLEAGIKSTNRNMNNNQQFFRINSTADGYNFDPLNSDHLKYNEQIASAYGMYSGKWKKFDFNGGIRAEQAFIDITSYQSYITTKRNYLSFFSSAFLKYTFSENELQLSYSRRVNRPDARALNPFVDLTDSLNIRRGNPDLKPEYVNSLELALAKNINSFNLTTSLYYRHTDDLISRFRTVDPVSGVATLMNVNFSSSDNYGLEIIGRYSFTKAGSLMASFNIYQNKINGTNIQSELQADATQWMSRLNANFKITPATSVQVTGNYMAPMTTVNGKIKGMSGVDAGFKQDLWKGKGSISVNVSDIFLMRKFTFINEGEFFYTSGQRRRESRVAMFTLSYKFGKSDQSLFRKKANQRGNQDSMPDSNIDY